MIGKIIIILLFNKLDEYISIVNIRCQKIYTPFNRILITFTPNEKIRFDKKTYLPIIHSFNLF